MPPEPLKQFRSGSYYSRDTPETYGTEREIDKGGRDTYRRAETGRQRQTDRQADTIVRKVSMLAREGIPTV